MDLYLKKLFSYSIILLYHTVHSICLAQSHLQSSWHHSTQGLARCLQPNQHANQHHRPGLHPYTPSITPVPVYLATRPRGPSILPTLHRQKISRHPIDSRRKNRPTSAKKSDKPFYPFPRTFFAPLFWKSARNPQKLHDCSAHLFTFLLQQVWRERGNGAWKYVMSVVRWSTTMGMDAVNPGGCG